MLTLNQIKQFCPKHKQPQLLVDTLTFVAGPVDVQTSVSHAMIAGAGQWIWVESVDGFTELTLVADKFTVVTKADYI